MLYLNNKMMGNNLVFWSTQSFSRKMERERIEQRIIGNIKMPPFIIISIIFSPL